MCQMVPGRNPCQSTTGESEGIYLKSRGIRIRGGDRTMTQTRNLIDDRGIRTDGRTPDESREIKIQIGVVKNADGSAFIEFGNNKIIVAVYGPRESSQKHMALPDRCVLRCRSTSPYSTDTRKNPAPSQERGRKYQKS